MIYILMLYVMMIELGTRGAYHEIMRSRVLLRVQPRVIENALAVASDTVQYI